MNLQQGRPWYANIGVEAAKGFVVGATFGLVVPALARTLSSVAIPVTKAVAQALGSTDPAIRFEGETGRFLESKGLLKAFNVRIGERQIDAIAGDARDFVIEITTAKGGGKLAQAAAQARATGMDVIIFGKNLSGGFVEEALRQGYRVARTEEELEKLVRER